MTRYILTVILLLSINPLFAQLHISAECGVVFNGYNNVQVPGNSEGTRISLTDNFEQDNILYFRTRVGYLIKKHHDIYVTVAPLKLYGQGSFSQPVEFGGITYAANTGTDALYQFSTYRLTYRYLFYFGERTILGVGATGLLRNAEVRLRQGNNIANTTDLGFVPLLSIYFEGEMVQDKLSFVLDVDALVGPQGRAEDGFAGLRYYPTPDINLQAGYRLIEGGADVDQVYNFALLHFVSLGMQVRLF